MKKLLRTLGIGIRSYKVAEVPWSFHVRVTYGSTTLESVARDYMTIFFLPLIPLGLSVYGQGRYVRMDNKKATNVLNNLVSMYGTSELRRQAKLIPVTRSTVLAVFIALIGALLIGAAGFLLFGALGSLTALLGAGIMNIVFVRVIGPKSASSRWRK